MFDTKYSYASDFDYFVNVSSKFKIYKSTNIYSYWIQDENQISKISQKNNYLELINLYNKYIKKKIKYIFNINILTIYISLYIKLFYYKLFNR